jgi:hypothetical protein
LANSPSLRLFQSLFSNSSITEKLKQELWKRYGTQEHPAEWDGAVYGGGKISQRFWEYLQSIEYLGLKDSSVMLDIGGGSPITGAGFFGDLVSGSAAKVVIIDPNIKEGPNKFKNIQFIRQNASYDNLKTLFKGNREITHVSCLSVFEHIPPEGRDEIIKAIDDHFRGEVFVATLEYHSKTSYFEHQLTAETLSGLFKNFKRFYLTDFCSSPVWCTNAYDAEKDIPLWYPAAFKFIRY